MKRTEDFHIHSCFSADGHLKPKKIVEIALRRHLTTIAVVDHDTIAGGVAARQVAPVALKLIVGAEICTERGEVIGLGLSSDIRSRILTEVVREIHQQGGLVYVPHPFDRLRCSALQDGVYDILPEIDYIETFNGRCVFQSDNDKAVAFARQNGIPELRGSDAHFAFEIGNLRPGPRAHLTAALGHALTISSKLILRKAKGSHDRHVE